MVKNYNKIAMKSVYTLLSAMILSSAANASNLTLISDEKTADVNIVIEGGTGTVLPNKKQINDVLKPGVEKTMVITKENFGTQTFVVTGKVKMVSADNVCKDLSVDKDYKIVFVPAEVGGTKCHAEEVAKADAAK